MNRWTHIIKSTVGGILLTLFLGYIGSITLFTHTHIINGVTIVHSHPHSKEHTSENDAHTETEIQLIESISSYLSEDTNPFIDIPANTCLQTVKTQPLFIKSLHSVQFAFDFSLRAPPFTIIL